MHVQVCTLDIEDHCWSSPWFSNKQHYLSLDRCCDISVHICFTLATGCAYALCIYMCICICICVTICVYMIDWCCFYYFVRNSLVALLEAPCARILSWDSWISVFPAIFFSRNAFWCLHSRPIGHPPHIVKWRLYTHEAISTHEHFCFAGSHLQLVVEQPNPSGVSAPRSLIPQFLFM